MVCQVLVNQLAKEKIKMSEKLKMRVVGCVLVFWVCGFFLINVKPPTIGG